MYYENDMVFAYAGGHLFGINAYDGSIKWENELKGFGYGTCIIASEHQNNAVINAQVAAQQAAATTANTAVQANNHGDG